MSHMIDVKTDTVYTPQGNVWEKTWHNLQTPVENGIARDGSNIPEVFSPIVECGVRPDLDGVAELDGEANEELARAMKNWKLLVADCRGGKAGKFVPVHVPKEGYTPHQNKVLFDAMVAGATEVLGADGFEIVTVGTLGSYSHFFMSLAIKGQDTFEIGAGDVWKQFFNLNSAHNGTMSSNRLLSVIRAVCMNTVQYSIADAEQNGTIAGISHTKNSLDGINGKTFGADLKVWLDNSKDFQVKLLAAKAMSMNLDGFRAFSAGVFTNPGSDKLSTNSFNRINEMESIFTRGDGNKGETVYDAINAFTQYFTRGGADSKVSPAKRIATANFGKGNLWKQEAIRAATDETAFADVNRRGAILYSDRLLVESASAAAN